MLNIGVIGCGAIGRDHIRRLTDIVPGCQVVACADYFEEAAIKVAAQYEGMKAYKTGEELITAPEVQAVVITSSDPSHAGYVLEALKAGRCSARSRWHRVPPTARKSSRPRPHTASVWYRSALCATMTAATPR